MEINESEWVTLELQLPAEIWDGLAHTIQWVDGSLYFDDCLILQDVKASLSACTSNT